AHVPAHVLAPLAGVRGPGRRPDEDQRVVVAGHARPVREVGGGGTGPQGAPGARSGRRAVEGARPVAGAWWRTLPRGPARRSLRRGRWRAAGTGEPVDLQGAGSVGEAVVERRGHTPDGPLGGPTFGDAARAVGVGAPARVLELSVGDGVVVCDGPVEVEVLLAGEVGYDRAAAHGACALHLVPPPTLSVRVYGSSVS